MKEDLRSKRSIPIGMVAGVCAVVVAVGGGITFWISSQSATEKTTVNPTTLPTASPLPVPSPMESPTVTLPITPPSPVQSPVSQPSPQPSTSPVLPIQTNVALYWVRDTGGNFELVPMEVLVQDTQDSEVVLTTAFNRLLTGDPESNTFSSIPPGTKLLNIAVKDDEVHLNLSREFTSGGGSASMISRVGQVVYTATSLQSNAKVWLYVEDEPLELLGGEGLEVPQPTTRENFLKEFQF